MLDVSTPHIGALAFWSAWNICTIESTRNTSKPILWENVRKHGKTETASINRDGRHSAHAWSCKPLRSEVLHNYINASSSATISSIFIGMPAQSTLLTWVAKWYYSTTWAATWMYSKCVAQWFRSIILPFTFESQGPRIKGRYYKNVKACIYHGHIWPHGCIISSIWNQGVHVYVRCTCMIWTWPEAQDLNTIGVWTLRWYTRFPLEISFMNCTAMSCADDVS